MFSVTSHHSLSRSYIQPTRKGDGLPFFKTTNQNSPVKGL